jgi:hypothetical protein
MASRFAIMPGSLLETGPRQLPNRHLRKRLEALKTLFPPPEGQEVFPEDLGDHHHHH